MYKYRILLNDASGKFLADLQSENPLHVGEELTLFVNYNKDVDFFKIDKIGHISTTTESFNDQVVTLTTVHVSKI